MNPLLLNDNVTATRRGPATVYHQRTVSAQAILDALESPGETLKASRKTNTRRVDGWVIKESRFEAGAGPLKHTFNKGRYRQAWIAANHLADHGDLTPAPLAFVERGRLGVITANAFVSKYLNGYCNVEQYVARIVKRPNALNEVTRVLDALAQAVNYLLDSGACHSDLSGKNILTNDGTAFYFIDLDSVVLGQAYTRERCLKNHIQLYDSFCDLLGDRILVPFITSMLPLGLDIRSWMPTIREGQLRRRTLTESKQR